MTSSATAIVTGAGSGIGLATSLALLDAGWSVAFAGHRRGALESAADRTACVPTDVTDPSSAPYTATKYAVTGLTRSISLDGRPFDIACSRIDIGNAASDMTASMTSGVPQADGSLKPVPRIDARHIAASVVHIAGMPLDANVQFMTATATKTPFIGRG